MLRSGSLPTASASLKADGVHLHTPQPETLLNRPAHMMKSIAVLNLNVTGVLLSLLFMLNKITNKQTKNDKKTNQTKSKNTHCFPQPSIKTLTEGHGPSPCTSRGDPQILTWFHHIQHPSLSLPAKRAQRQLFPKCCGGIIQVCF